MSHYGCKSKSTNGLTETDQDNLLRMHAPESAPPLVALGLQHGAAVLNSVLGHLGGARNIPTRDFFWDQLQRLVRDPEIQRRFNGANYAELGGEYGLTERQVRRIVHG